jgi:hypothetical protein
MNVRHVLAALALSALVAPSANAQNQYQTQIVNQIGRLSPIMQGRGWSPFGSPTTGSLNTQSDESILVNLNGGGHYMVAGVCDNDCDDVDIQVFSSDGTKLGEDMLTDDQPRVEFNASYTGQYRVKILMASCKTNPCYYGVQVYQTGGGK